MITEKHTYHLNQFYPPPPTSAPHIVNQFTLMYDSMQSALLQRNADIQLEKIFELYKQSVLDVYSTAMTPQQRGVIYVDQVINNRLSEVLNLHILESIEGRSGEPRGHYTTDLGYIYTRVSGMLTDSGVGVYCFRQLQYSGLSGYLVKLSKMVGGANYTLSTPRIEYHNGWLYANTIVIDVWRSP